MSTRNKKRFLKYHFHELENCCSLPVNYSYIQLYTGILLDEKGEALPFENEKTIVASAYKIPEINLYPVFQKPISRCFPIS